MTTVGDKYFSEHCLDELDRLDDDGLVITRDGVPYAKVVRLGGRRQGWRSDCLLSAERDIEGEDKDQRRTS